MGSWGQVIGFVLQCGVDQHARQLRSSQGFGEVPFEIGNDVKLKIPKRRAAGFRSAPARRRGARISCECQLAGVWSSADRPAAS